jgi:two-component system, NtrC family, sensor histidine kinase KinB
MIFLFLIILVLSVFSGFYLNRLSGKIGAILKENYLSVVYARDMNEDITAIGNELTTSYLRNIPPDTAMIDQALNHFSHTLAIEKNNLTEPGEDKLVKDIEGTYESYKQLARNNITSDNRAEILIMVQNKSAVLRQSLLFLSQMNGKAIEVKTDEARIFSGRALTRMTILASICFLIGMSYTFSLASYLNQRISTLHNGIRQIVASNFNQHLYFEGNRDEFYEISVVFNEMADRLKENEQKLSITLPKGTEKSKTDLEELRKLLAKLRLAESEAEALISKFDKK